MTKLNKTQTEHAAKAAALKNPAAQLSAAQLEMLSYDERKALALKLAQDASIVQPPSAYPAAYIPAYEATVLNLWHNTQQQLKAARHNWNRASKGMPAAEARQKIQALLEGMHIRGARIMESRMEVERAGRLNASLYYSFERSWSAEGTCNPDEPGQKAGPYTLELKISTSGSSWTPAQMAVLNAIHAELLAAANELECAFANWDVIWTYGMPAAEEAVS
jgi:hypothetical protein